MRKGLWIWICVSVALAALCFYAAKRLAIARIAHAQIRVVPFVLQAEVYDFAADPNGKLFHRKTIARRADGATAQVSTVGDLSWGTTTRKVTYADGSWASFYDLISAKTTWRTKEPSALAAMKQRLLNPPKDCVFNTAGNPHLIGSDMVLGQTVAVVQSADEIGRVTSWSARDLGCQELQFRFERRQADGSYKLQAEQRATSLKIGEPPSVLFDSSPDYKELKPSEVHKRYFEKLPIKQDENTMHEGEQLDKLYEAQQH